MHGLYPGSLQATMLSLHFTWILLLLADFIICSPKSCKIAPEIPLKSLIIDDEKYVYKQFENRPMLYYKTERSCLDIETIPFDQSALRILYKMVEEDRPDLQDELLFDIGNFHAEIFELNPKYCYTPAEWCIHLNKMNVFKLFIQRTFMKPRDIKLIDRTGKLLMAMAIQYRNLKAVEILKNYAVFQIRGKGFLSIAAQHYVKPELVDFLLYNCRLIEEIDSPSANGKYPKPLISCIKFNNFPMAVSLLEKGAAFGSDLAGNRHESVLATILRKKKTRALKQILVEIPYLCDYKDIEGNGLLHYAVTYSSDPEMIDLIRSSCPDLDVDSQNLHLMTPLTTVLSLQDCDQVEGFSLKLIKLSANPLKMSSEHICPLDLIVNREHYTIFTFILDHSPLDLCSTGILKEMVKTVSTNSMWTWLDRLLNKFSLEINVDWINFSGVKFEDLLAQNAHSTFEIALSKKRLNKLTFNLPSDFLEQIAMAGLDIFLNAAIKYGYDLDSIDVSQLSGSRMIRLVKAHQAVSDSSTAVDTELI